MIAQDALSATVGAFGAFAPANLVKARKDLDPTSPSDEFDLRLGQALALTWSFVLVAMIARESGSSKPFVYWTLGAGGMIVAYELAFRSRAGVPDEGDDDGGCGCQ
jgi:hypothetical protein